MSLVRCGVTQPETLEAVQGQGFSSMLLFLRLSEDGIGDFVKYVKLDSELDGDAFLVY